MTLTEEVREKLREEAGRCPTCGHASTTTRDLGRKLGVSYTSLWRFLGGGTPSAGLLDRLYARYFGDPDPESLRSAHQPAVEEKNPSSPSKP